MEQKTLAILIGVGAGSIIMIPVILVCWFLVLMHGINTQLRRLADACEHAFRAWEQAQTRMNETSSSSFSRRLAVSDESERSYSWRTYPQRIEKGSNPELEIHAPSPEEEQMRFPI